MSKPEPLHFPLDDLLDALVSNGFYLGVDTHLRLQRYLDWFVRKTNREPATLKYQLAALLCSNEADQQRFYTLFDQKLAHFIAQKQGTTASEKNADSVEGQKNKTEKAEKAEPKATPATSRAQTTQPTLTEGKSGPVRVELKFPSNDLRIWNLSEIDQAVRPLREKEWATVLEWDIPATIRSTIRAGGMPTFELRRRKRAPQYLLLIDQRGPRDHLAGLYAELAIELNRRDVDAEHYFYDRIPSRCWKDRRDYGSYTSIESLQSQFPGSRLLLIGEPEGLLDLPQLRPSNLAADLRDAWPQTALLCTRPTAEWGNAELTLCQMFPVVPANAAGLASLTLQWAATEVYAPQYWKIKCPEATVPPVRVARPQEAEPVLENLRYYLGRDGFLWLCAAALYPELYYELTALLHDESIPPPAGLQAGDWDMNRVWWTALLRLSRLDWFRKGNIPLPAREKLRQYFDQNVLLQQRGKVWEQLVKLLEITSPPPGSFAADSLQVTLDWYKTEQQMTDPQLTEVVRQQLGAALQEKMQSAAINDPLARRVLQKPSQGIATDHPLFIGHVTANVIDIRSGPSESDPAIGQLQKNTRVDIFVFSNDRNWYRIGENWWVSAHSVKTEQIFRRQIETLLQKGRVTAQSLNIRSGPSASDPVIGRLEQNAQVNIFEISNDRNWYRIGENWWMSANFVELEQKGTPEQQAGRLKHILWVDDHPEKIINVRIQLERRSDITLAISTETEQAFQILATRRFDLVISDAGRGDDHAAGLKLLRGMRERKIDTPFIVYTSATNFDYYRKEFMKAGALGVFREEEELMGFVGAQLHKMAYEAQQTTGETAGKATPEQVLSATQEPAADMPDTEETELDVVPDIDIIKEDTTSQKNILNEPQPGKTLKEMKSPQAQQSLQTRPAYRLEIVQLRGKQGVVQYQIFFEVKPEGLSPDHVNTLLRSSRFTSIKEAQEKRDDLYPHIRNKELYHTGTHPSEDNMQTVLFSVDGKIELYGAPLGEAEAKDLLENIWELVSYEASNEKEDFHALPVEEQIKMFIAEGRTEEALALLAQHSSDALLLQARYSDGKKQYNMGLIEFSEWQRIQGQINNAALELTVNISTKISSRQTDLGNTTVDEKKSISKKKGIHRNSGGIREFVHYWDDLFVREPLDKFLQYVKKSFDHEEISDESIELLHRHFQIEELRKKGSIDNNYFVQRQTEIAKAAGEILKKINSYYLPILSVPEIAENGFGSQYTDSLQIEEWKYIEKGNIRNKIGVRVVGNAMIPAYSERDILVCARVNLSNISERNPVVIVTKDNNIFLKKIKKVETKLDLISLNPEYKTFQIPLDEIVEIWIVESKIK